MCSLFGVLDYGHVLSAKQKNHILSTLSEACEVRGTDATGIAYHTRSGLQIFKRPLPAHRLRLRVPKHSTLVMGHTRLTTQGNEKRNYNNHPFPGKAGKLSFALAHNGVLSNDKLLHLSQQLPATRVETDSYIAVQLLEKEGVLSFDSLTHMAQSLQGTFTITVMDEEDNLYLVKGNNPLVLYHWSHMGLYLYASTKEILNHILQKLHFSLGVYQEVPIHCGDIVHINATGHLVRGTFDDSHLSNYSIPYYSPYHYIPSYYSTVASAYIEDLKTIAPSFGYSPDDIESLLEDGFTPEEIEEYLYEMESYHQYELNQ